MILQFNIWCIKVNDTLIVFYSLFTWSTYNFKNSKIPSPSMEMTTLCLNIASLLHKTDRYKGGFLKGSRTTDNLFILNGLIERQLHMGQSLIVCHVDFTQAFDRVNRNILFYKIKKFGCTGRVIDTLQNLYSKTRCRVNCNGGISDIIWENVGVNQGGNASPILFRSYLSDIKD